MTGAAMTASDLPDYGLTVRLVEDDHGHPLYAVFDSGGLAESAPSLEALSPMARITWAKQQGWTREQIAAAGKADGMLYRGIDLDGPTG
jgi:hypothetical protein